MSSEVRSKKKKGLHASGRQKGFTIVELMVGMAILSVLLGITLAAVNPLEQFAKTRDTKRRADVEALANAIQQHIATQKGVIPEELTTSNQEIATGEVDLCEALIPQYISALPQDPSQNNGAKILPASCSSYSTGYEIRLLDDEHFRVEAPHAEVAEDISQIR